MNDYIEYRLVRQPWENVIVSAQGLQFVVRMSNGFEDREYRRICVTRDQLLDEIDDLFMLCLMKGFKLA